MNNKQQKPSTNPIKINSTRLAERLKEQREVIKLSEKRKRTVYEAICALIEPVSEKEMFNHLQVLDLHSWAEVIEERFLGKVCGYPVCGNSISIDFRRKFVCMKREGRKEFLPVEAEPNKFCSDRCMCLSRAMAIQLDNEKQQINSLRLMSTKLKEFKLPEGDEWRNFLKIDKCSDKEQIIKNNVYAEAQLDKGINELKVTDNVEESSEDEEEEKEDSEEEEKQFLEKIKSLTVNTKIHKNTSRCFIEDKEGKENYKNQKESKKS
uniref:RNA polymerase II subunit B1 CTD phosphatase RPAP2 homolog n=1 Tax=Meloidogyne hapla TaxID=6305 RepID=A0A1I8AZJ9_MELHA